MTTYQPLSDAELKEIRERCEDAKFITKAITDVPRLLDEVDSLRAENGRLREGLSAVATLMHMSEIEIDKYLNRSIKENKCSRFRGRSIAGANGIAVAGDYGCATAENHGIAVAGDYGTATTENPGIAIAGYSGTATAGDYGTAIVGIDGSASAGVGGVLVITATDGALICLPVDGVKIKPNVKYGLNDRGDVVEAKPCE